MISKVKQQQERIIKRLRKFIQVHPKFTEVNEVVYSMVQIRKFLETSKENYYTALQSYCNWLMHYKLNKESSTEFISSLISADIINNRSPKKILNKIKDAAYDIFKFKKLKYELEKFSNDMNLPIDFSAKNWNSFCKLFLKELQTSEMNFEIGIPIKFKIECENDNRYKYVMFLGSKRIGSVVLKYKEI